MIADPGLNLTFTSVSFSPPLTFAKTVSVLQIVADTTTTQNDFPLTSQVRSVS